MSDTRTNIEFNDVLSSIRRLVSEEVAKDPEPARPDRFVLTPALRVRDNPDPGEAVLGARDAPVVESTTEAGGEAPDTAELAEILSTAAAISDPAPVAVDNADVPGAEPAERISQEYEAMELAWKSELARVAAARRSVTEAADTDATQVSAGSDQAETPSLETRIAELEEAVSHSHEEWEPDGSEPDSESSQRPRRHIFEVVDNTRKPTDDDASAPDAPETVENETIPMFSHSTIPRPVPYLLSEVVSPDASDVPDGPYTGDVTPAPDASDIVNDDDVFLDVEALRRMIADVVREELGGKLGEIITRNVRRMVNQEIDRAISHHDAAGDSD